MIKKELFNKETKLPKFNLQLFAGEGEGAAGEGDTPPAGEGTEGSPEGNPEDKAFNQEEVNDIVSKRLAKERAKFEAEYKEKLALEKQEAEKLAKLSESERAEALLQIEKDKFNTEMASFQREKLVHEVTKQLAEKSLPIIFAEVLAGETAEESLANIKKFSEDWNKELEKAVIAKLGSTSPGGSGGAAGAGTTSIGSRIAAQRKLEAPEIKENPYF